MMEMEFLWIGLFQAWSQIVYQLVPNVKGLEKTLENFADIIDADEILLFEKATFLVNHPSSIPVCLISIK